MNNICVHCNKEFKPGEICLLHQTTKEERELFETLCKQAQAQKEAFEFFDSVIQSREKRNNRAIEEYREEVEKLFEKNKYGIWKFHLIRNEIPDYLRENHLLNTLKFRISYNESEKVFKQIEDVYASK